MRLGIVGCGNIASRYASSIAAAPGLELVAATDVLPGRADEFVADHGGTSYASLGALLGAEEVDAVVNLTAPQVHAEVTAAALEAARGLGLSCAPATLLGEAQQTAWKLVRDGAVGRVRAAYAEANWGPIESWHPSPEAILRVGALVDVGIYPLTVLTAMFGPARSVVAYATLLEPDRVRLDGTPFRLDTPDFVVATIELADGTIARVTASFYVGPSKQRGLEFHGDDGSLYLASWAEFDSRLELAPRGREYEPAPLLREPYRGIDWSRPIVDLADALRDSRPPRANGAHAAHVVEVLGAAEKSYREGGVVEVTSEFPQPQPLEWAL